MTDARLKEIIAEYINNTPTSEMRGELIDAVEESKSRIADLEEVLTNLHRQEVFGGPSGWRIRELIERVMPVLARKGSAK